MKKLIIGSFLSAIAYFAWGFLYFGVIQAPYSVIGPAIDETALMLKEDLPEDGVYLYPIPTADNSHELMKRGPIAMVHIKRDGFENPAGMMIKGFLHGWAYCILLAFLLKQICKKTGYTGRVGFVLLAGAAGALLSRFGDAIWWHQSWAWQFTYFAYEAIGSGFIGLILAKFIPKQTS